MKITYNNYFLKLLSEDTHLDTQKSKECIKEIASTGKINKITEYISVILKEVSGKTFIKFDEKYIELLYYSLLRNTSKFNIHMEYDCTKFEEKRENGIKQLNDYSKDPRLKEKVKKYLVIFVGNELKILESID